MPRQHSFIPGLISALAILLIAAGVFLNRQAIIDQYRYSTSQPSSHVKALGDQLKLTQRGDFLLYASEPELLSKDPFNAACKSLLNERSTVLGCYKNFSIAVYDVSNDKLAGIEQVTIAHEMLHAAYDRLSETERNRINTLLEQQSQNLGASQQRIDDLMAQYDKTEPGERLNELHSIIGTEVTNLSPELETYYKKYFTDRSIIVHFASSYQGVFDQLKSKQDSLVKELNALADTIDNTVSQYKQDQKVLSLDVSTFNTRAKSGALSESEYSSQRAQLEVRQANLRTTYDNIQELVSQYDQKKAELTTINGESETLNRSINSSVTPVQGL
jgi:hypothetical protein